MNYWVEYWKKENRISLNNHAQMRENAVWTPPNEKDVLKRFCQSKEDACKFATAMQEQGYMASVKQDGIFYK